MKYTILGEPLPSVICNVEAGETLITEGGAMSWMSPNMRMQTTSGGGLGKMFGRMLSGDTLFLNRYTAQGGPGEIAFASCFPGSIRDLKIVPGEDIIVQKSAFLAAEEGVELSVFFQKKFGAGLFGGEGIFNTVVKGPGRIILQTMPVNKVAGSILPYIPSSGT